MNKPRVLSLLAIFSIALTFVISQTTFAGSSTISEEDETIYSLNNIMFYQKCPTTSSGNSEICGDNKNYAGEQVFTDEQMKAIEANQPFYEKAASEYDIPWQVIAVIHKREHGLARSNPANGQGVYQFYSAERRASCAGGNFTPGKISDEQFQIQTNCAAEAIKNSYGSGLDLSTDDGIKKMFFRYNGTASVYVEQALRLGFTSAQADNGEGSPYVMNRYDAKREPSNTWGQIKTDGGSISYPANSDFGAFVYYKAITCDGSTSEPDDSEDAVENPGNDNTPSNLQSSSDASGNAQKIAEVAFKLAYPKGQSGYTVDRSKSDYGAYPGFVEATKELGTWNKNKSHGPDCGFFVKAVMAYANPSIVNKPDSAVMDGHQSYAKSHPDQWEVIDYGGKKIPASDLQSGDVIWWKDAPKKQHYFIVAKNPDDGNLYKVEASYCSRNHWSCGTWGRVTTKLTSSSSLPSHKEQLLFRAKGGSSAPSCDPNTGGSNNINATGAALAWPLGTSWNKVALSKGKVLESVLTNPGQTDSFSGTGAGTKEFQKAFVETKMNNSSLRDKSFNGKYPWRYGAYCSGFTATVVRYSGYDPHFTASLSVGKYEQVSYARSHPDLWEVITWDKQKSSLKGGDVLVSSNHSWMIVEDESGELYRAEAGLTRTYFGRISEYSGGATGTTYIIRATHANNSNVGVSVTSGVKTTSITGKVSNDVSKGNGDIGATARLFAWPIGTSSKQYKNGRPPETVSKWKQMLKDAGHNAPYGDKEMGACCTCFVWGVLRYAGYKVGDLKQELYKEFTAERGWEKVGTNIKYGEMQDGDVLVDMTHGKWFPQHYALFLRDDDGQGYRAEASVSNHDYGRITKKVSDSASPGANYDIWRNTNNKHSSKTSDSECNVCPANNDSSSDSGTLQDGGVTSEEEAQKIVDAYNKANLSRLSGLGYACNGDLHKNCVNFPKWFIATYLNGMNHSFMGNGGDIAKNFYNANKSKFPNLKESSVPVAYSIFSVRHGKLTSSSEGHTGVVLGVKGDQVFIGEAGWCQFAGRVRTLSVNEFLAHREHTFIEVNEYTKGL